MIEHISIYPVEGKLKDGESVLLDKIHEIIAWINDHDKRLAPIQFLECQPGGWISVKDRLPEDGQVVAFIIDKSVDYYGGSTCAGRFRYFNYGDMKLPEFGTWGLCGLTASHWMPLPEPPK